MIARSAPALTISGAPPSSHTANAQIGLLWASSTRNGPGVPSGRQLRIARSAPALTISGAPPSKPGDCRPSGTVAGVRVGCFPDLYGALSGDPPDQVITL